VRALSRLDEVHKRVQVQALGFSLAATALLTFGYGFLESIGWPVMNGTLLITLIAHVGGGRAADARVPPPPPIGGRGLGGAGGAPTRFAADSRRAVRAGPDRTTYD